MVFATRFCKPEFPGITFAPDSSKTIQDFKDEADVNKLVNRFSETGSFYDPLVTAQAAVRKPLFDDFSNVPDYQAAQELVLQAQNQFDSLPSAIRDRFANDPAQFLAFVSDDSNRDEAIKLGIVDAPVVSETEAPKEP